MEQCEPPDGMMSARQAVVVRVVVKDKRQVALKPGSCSSCMNSNPLEMAKHPAVHHRVLPSIVEENWTRIPKAGSDNSNVDVHDHTQNHEALPEETKNNQSHQSGECTHLTHT